MMQARFAVWACMPDCPPMGEIALTQTRASLSAPKPKTTWPAFRDRGIRRGASSREERARVPAPCLAMKSHTPKRAGWRACAVTRHAHQASAPVRVGRAGRASAPVRGGRAVRASAPVRATCYAPPVFQ